MRKRAAPVAASLLIAAAAATLTVACYQTPQAEGPYRCKADGSCTGGLLCDDGICCQPFGAPSCPTLVLDGGVCASGDVPQTWFLDKDGDAFGDPNSARLACARPLSVPETAPGALWLQQGGDCDDAEPGIKPDAAEACDNRDNDCDGEVDEGLPAQNYWQDLDGDTFGDRAIPPRPQCAPFAPYLATVGGDCDDDDGAVNPAATETCNGVDDDCDDQPDDVVPVMCQSGLPGQCAAGMSSCQNAQTVCVATVMPGTVAETCNLLDDDCDGTTDEKPDCGGPVSLLSAAQSDIAVKHLASVLNGTPTQCPHLYGGTTPADGWSQNTWTGSGSQSHVLYARRSGGGSWDLSKAGTTLRLELSWTSSHGWSSHSQPVVMICGPGGYLRLVHDPSMPLMTASSGNFRQNVPVRGGLDWLVGSGSATPDAVLRDVRYIELVVQPAFSSTTSSTYSITLDVFGFP